MGAVVPLDEEAEEDDCKDEGGLEPEGGHLLCALVGREGGGGGNWMSEGGPLNEERARVGSVNVGN